MKVSGQGMFLGIKTIPSKKNVGVFYYNVNIADENGQTMELQIDNPTIVQGLVMGHYVNCEIDIIQGKYPRYNLILCKKVVI